MVNAQVLQVPSMRFFQRTLVFSVPLLMLVLWLFPGQADAARNLAPANSSSSLQAETEVWRGNATMVEFSDLTSDADRLEQSLKSRVDASAAGPDEWEQVRRKVQSLEDELGRDEWGM